MRTLPRPPTHHRQSNGGRGRSHFDTLLDLLALVLLALDLLALDLLAARRSPRLCGGVAGVAGAGGVGGGVGAAPEARSVEVVADEFAGGTASLTAPR